MFRKRRKRKAVATAAIQRPQWGQPAPCPGCGSLGVLLHVDPVHAVMHLECRHCGAKWHLGEADVENAPNLDQRGRARALKEQEETIRSARLAAAGAEADWQRFREKLAAEGIDELR